jgi:hypothetical protein
MSHPRLDFLSDEAQQFEFVNKRYAPAMLFCALLEGYAANLI